MSENNILTTGVWRTAQPIRTTLVIVQTLEKINQLRAELGTIEPFAPDCVGLNRIMKCRAFFPGGDGLWFPGRGAGDITTLFLGSDFNNESNFYAEFEKHESLMQDSPATWNGLTKLIDGARIDVTKCFFTNAWPCLREGSYPNAGDPPGAKDAGFTSRCLTFFERTLEILRPQFVIPLGKWPTGFVHHLAPRQMQDWQKPKWKLIDRSDQLTVSIKGMSMTFVPVIHPCLPNHRYRSRHISPALEAAHIRRIIENSADGSPFDQLS